MFIKKNAGQIILLFFIAAVAVVANIENLPLSDSECRNVSELSYNQRELCWYKEVKKEMSRGGVDRGLKYLKKLHDRYPEFASGCHDVTHLIGEEAYKEFRIGKKLSLGVETSYCGYGFYHGFIESMLFTTSDYSEVRNFCESANIGFKSDIEAPNAIYSCYHGIGHSTFNIHDESLWGDETKMAGPAITGCEKVTEGLSEEKTKQCVTGVFNALGIAYSNNEYNLKLRERDPVWYCRTLNDVYKKACFMEVSLAWFYTTMGGDGYSISEAFKFVKNERDEIGVDAMVFALTSDYIRLHRQPDDIARVVGSCREVRGAMNTCIEGIGLGLLGWGKPGEEYKDAISFCNSAVLDEEEKDVCFSYVLGSLRSMYSAEKRLNICESGVAQEYQEACQ